MEGSLRSLFKKSDRYNRDEIISSLKTKLTQQTNRAEEIGEKGKNSNKKNIQSPNLSNQHKNLNF